MGNSICVPLLSNFSDIPKAKAAGQSRPAAFRMLFVVPIGRSFSSTPPPQFHYLPSNRLTTLHRRFFTPSPQQTHGLPSVALTQVIEGICDERPYRPDRPLFRRVERNRHSEPS